MKLLAHRRADGCRGVPHAPGAPAVELRDVSVRWGGHTALEHVSFALAAGDLLAVVGPNGAGKSTLLKVLAGALAPTAGEVRVYGHRPGGHICIAYLPQRSQVDWGFPVTVRDVVMMGRIGRLGPLRRPRAGDRGRVEAALARVGIAHLASRQIRELSGGEQQRMFIARALAQEAELVLLDEPLAGLDTPAQEGILDLLAALREQGMTVLVALHELDFAARLPKALLLHRRPIGFGPPEEVFTPDRLREAYGAGLRIIHTPTGLAMLGDSCCAKDADGLR
ncbi:metal ABC transporter ATP-binding protein [Candidatus Bipolaricaulota bacterium]|nr:metal ABC transporter ATP-binding protein [Candidatus Bipolaricaulota bacterium]